jgi:hypothetical protein
MRYWAYVNNEVRGPFEKEKLAALPGFGGTWVICPEDQAAGAAPGWKEASNYPEVMNALNQPPAPAPAAAPPPVPAPAQEKPKPAESPLLMTMRGTLISDPVVDGHVVEQPAGLPKPSPVQAAAPAPAPAPAPAQEKPKPAESPLMMTMRGTLISDPVVDGHVVERFPSTETPPRAAVAAQTPAPAGGGTDPVMQKLDQISAMLASLANGQSQLLERVGRAEASVAAMKALLFPEQPKK